MNFFVNVNKNIKLHFSYQVVAAAAAAATTGGGSITVSNASQLISQGISVSPQVSYSNFFPTILQLFFLKLF